MENQSIRWGIIGAGSIAHKFVRDLAYAKSAEAAAVCSRSVENARRFAQEYNIPNVYNSSEEMVQQAEVDIVYVASPHPSHKDHVLACLRAGKAVLCEKPFTVNAAEAEEAIRYAREHNVFLMEAMWTRYLPAIRKVREWLDQGRIGEVRLLKADFGFRVGWNPQGRLLNPELGGGALLDAGIYPISFASMVFGTAPSQIASTVQIGETGVDEQFSVLFGYPSGKSAVLNGAVRLRMNNDATIFGTEGIIHIPGFLAAHSATLRIHGAEEESFTDNRTANGYAFEAEEAMQCLREHRTESRVMPLEESLSLMKTMDAIRQQWGLRYPFE